MKQAYKFPNQRRISAPIRQSGLAILTVLLIIALMVTLLGFLVEQQHLLIRRIANQNVAEQGHQYAAGVDAWASRLLHDDQNRGVDYWGEDWAAFGAPPKPPGEGNGSFSLDLSSQQEKEALPEVDFGNDATLEYQIIDLMGRYNLNNLANKNEQYLRAQRSIFLNLLGILDIGEFDDREQLFAALADWLDEGDGVRPNGTESGDYRIKKTPYHASDQKLSSLGELRFVEGFSQEIINDLAPYVTVLPIDNAQININTTTTEVLSAMNAVPVVDTGSVEAFLVQREEEGFQGFQGSQIQGAITAIIGTAASEGRVVPNMLQTRSQFYQVNTRVILGDYLYCTETKVLRETPDPGGSGGARVTILNREHSTLCNEIVR